MEKGKLYSILNNKCPRCNQGDVFATKSLFTYRNFAKMNSHCSVCGEDFQREVGFYYGAMYVSYALTVAYMVGMTIVFVWLTGWFSIPGFFYFLFPSMLLLFPFFYRLSRLIWLNMFVKYQDETNKSLQN
jgi:uncharacterized protein (DUF983 family)